MVTSSCSQVQFLDIPDVITAAGAICSFKISNPLMTVSEGDKIGLFMAGWSDVKSCNLFVPLPATALNADREDTITVSFDVKSTDICEGEFYQFCYVTASGAVRGVSSAFEINDRTDDDDLVIIDSGTDFMSISSSGVSPQEWQQMMDEKRLQEQKIRELKEKLTAVMAECGDLIICRDALNRQLLAECAKATQLQTTFEETRVTLSKVEGEAADLRARLSDAEQAHDAATKRVAELEEERMQLLMKSVELSEVPKAETDAKLRDLQEELMAAVANGDRVKDTLATHVQVVEKLSAELEQSKSNEYAVQVTVQNLQQQLEAAHSKTETAESDAVGLQLLTEKQAAKISELQQKVNDLNMEGTISFGLQSAIGTLKERLKKTQAELRVKKAELKNTLTGSGQNIVNETLVAENKRLSAELQTVKDNVCSVRMPQANGSNSKDSFGHQSCKLSSSHCRSQRDPALPKSGAGNIFIKNLDKSIDNKALYDSFSTFGNILSCEVAMDENGESKGFGFVQFKTEESARNLMVDKVNGMFLNGKKVFVSKFMNRRERMGVLGDKAKKFTNVYVMDFGNGVPQEELHALFKAYGPIVSTRLMYDEDGNTRSVSFVSFEDHEAAQCAVMELNDKKVGGSEMYIGPAQREAKRCAELEDRFECLKQVCINRNQGINLYVENLDDDVDNEKLRTMFSQFGNITSAEVITEGGRSKGFGFVCFSSSEDVIKAMTEMNGRIMGSKPLYVALAQRKEDCKAQLAAQYMQRMQTIVVPQGQQAATMGQLYQPGGAGYFVPAAMQQRFYSAPPQMQVRATPRWASVRPGQQPGAAGFATMQQAGGPRGMRQPTHPGAYVVRQPQQAAAGAGGAAAMSARPITGAPQAGGPPQRFATVGKAAMPGGRIMAPAPAGTVVAPRQPQPFCFAANTRNPPLPVPAAGVIPPQMQQQQAAVMIQGQDPLTASMLAAAPAQEQKQMLGERLFPLIQGLYPDLAGMLTGMLLTIDNAELLHMLESGDAFRLKVEEAVAVLQAHQAKQKD